MTDKKVARALSGWPNVNEEAICLNISCVPAFEHDGKFYCLCDDYFGHAFKKGSKLPLMQVLLPSLLIHYYSMEYPEHVLLETLTSKARLLDTIKNTIIGRHILHPSNSTHHRYK